MTAPHRCRSTTTTAVNESRAYGLDPSNTKVQIVQEIKNSEANHLGMPLPAGRIRLYRRDSDGQMEFIGEDTIDHTPAEETIKLATGTAFDVKGSRRQTDFHVNVNGHILDESFEIKLTNQKQQPVTVNVVEHLYRGANWEIADKSSAYTKTDSHTVSSRCRSPQKATLHSPTPSAIPGDRNAVGSSSFAVLPR